MSSELHPGECKHLITQSTCVYCSRPLREPVDRVLLAAIERDLAIGRHELDADHGGLEATWGPWVRNEYPHTKCARCDDETSMGVLVRYSSADDGYVCASCGKEGEKRSGWLPPEIHDRPGHRLYDENDADYEFGVEYEIAGKRRHYH